MLHFRFHHSIRLCLFMWPLIKKIQVSIKAQKHLSIGYQFNFQSFEQKQWYNPSSINSTFNVWIKHKSTKQCMGYKCYIQFKFHHSWLAWGLNTFFWVQILYSKRWCSMKTEPMYWYSFLNIISVFFTFPKVVLMWWTECFCFFNNIIYIFFASV